MKRFVFTIEADFVLDEEQIWPDAPVSHPSAQAALEEAQSCASSVANLVEAWNLLPLRVSVQELGGSEVVRWSA